MLWRICRYPGLVLVRSSFISAKQTVSCQDKLYELDKSWENNLVFYGINQMKDEEERPNLIESRVREILRLIDILFGVF